MIQKRKEMKRYLLILFISLFSCAAHAQDVYNYVLDNATKVVNSPTSGFAQAQIAQFKRTALIYIKQKSFERTDSVPAKFLNTQAYYLSEFLSLFFKEILKDKKLSEAQRKDKIMLFMDASVGNPLFYDEDKETTLAFVNDSNELTPFSLDTNWQNAFLAAEENLKKLQK